MRRRVPDENASSFNYCCWRGSRHRSFCTGSKGIDTGIDDVTDDANPNAKGTGCVEQSDAVLQCDGAGSVQRLVAGADRAFHFFPAKWNVCPDSGPDQPTGPVD